MLEHFDNLVEASAKAISNIKFDKVVVWEGGGQNGTSATANWLHNMARTLPPMMQVMKDIGGVEIPETLANLASRGPGHGQRPRPRRRASRPTPSRPSRSARSLGHCDFEFVSDFVLRISGLIPLVAAVSRWKGLRSYRRASRTRCPNSGRMIFSTASRTAAGEPGIVNRTVRPISPPVARLSIAAAPICW